MPVTAAQTVPNADGILSAYKLMSCCRQRWSQQSRSFRGLKHTISSAFAMQRLPRNRRTMLAMSRYGYTGSNNASGLIITSGILSAAALHEIVAVCVYFLAQTMFYLGTRCCHFTSAMLCAECSGVSVHRVAKSEPG